MADSDVTALLQIVLNDPSYDRRLAATALVDLVRAGKPSTEALYALAADMAEQRGAGIAAELRSLVDELGLQ